MHILRGEPEFPRRRALSTREAAAYTGVSETYIRKLRMDNDQTGPSYVLFGKKPTYFAEHLDAWLTANTVIPGGAS